MQVNGTLFGYYFICKRKLWYHANHIQPENTYDAVNIGKAIDEYTYKNKKKGILIDDHIMLDFADASPFVHEVKKSNKMETAHIMQVKYYIYVLQQKGMDVKWGKLHYPELRETVDIEYTKEDETEIEGLLKNIHDLLSAQSPSSEKPAKSICRKCAYFELCFG